jgi:hypothetical protein
VSNFEDRQLLYAGVPIIRELPKVVAFAPLERFDEFRSASWNTINATNISSHHPSSESKVIS